MSKSANELKTQKNKVSTRILLKHQDKNEQTFCTITFTVYKNDLMIKRQDKK